MKAVLFAAGASFAAGQSTVAECYQIGVADMTNCTAALGCQVLPGSCYRTVGMNNVTACSTDSKTCSANNECKAGASVTNYTSCSMCADQCTTHQNNASCVDAVGGACAWAGPMCTVVAAPTPAVHCTDKTTASACSAEPNCWWWSASWTACGGASQTASMCMPCNATTTPSITTRSALKNSVGKSCTWAATAGYASPFTFALKSVEQNSQCGTFAAPSMDDTKAVTTALFEGVAGIPKPFASVDVVPTCTQASSAAALVPGLAILGFVVFSA
jgi:hypothetical protein